MLVLPYPHAVPFRPPVRPLFPLSYSATDADRITYKTRDAASLHNGVVVPSPVIGKGVKGEVKEYDRSDKSLRTVTVPDKPPWPPSPFAKKETEAEKDNICPDDCNGHGMCLKGKCSCFPDYTGRACSLDKEVKSQGRLRKALTKIGATLARLPAQERRVLGVET